MKAWFVLPTVCISLTACDMAPKQAAAPLEEAPPAATPKGQPKPGEWMWDKEQRQNPLEAGTHTKRYR